MIGSKSKGGHFSKVCPASFGCRSAAEAAKRNQLLAAERVARVDAVAPEPVVAAGGHPAGAGDGRDGTPAEGSDERKRNARVECSVHTSRQLEGIDTTQMRYIERQRHH